MRGAARSWGMLPGPEAAPLRPLRVRAAPGDTPLSRVAEGGGSALKWPDFVPGLAAFAGGCQREPIAAVQPRSRRVFQVHGAVVACRRLPRSRSVSRAAPGARSSGLSPGSVRGGLGTGGSQQWACLRQHGIT